MHEKPSLKNDIEEITKLQHGILDLATGNIKRALSKQPQITAELHKILASQLARQAVDKANEMLGPILATVRAANPSQTEAEDALKEYGFTQISQFWERFLEVRCDALGRQLQDARALLKQPIIDVVVLDGDPHNGAYQPLKLTTESDGMKQDFLYKSVDPTALSVVHAAASAVCQRLGIELFVDGPEFSSNDSYIRTFTQISKPKSTSELERYFYAFGAICSVASYLEITDLHFENFIATKEGPKIIDIEFILSNTQYQKSKWSYKNSGLFEPGSSPIAQTSWHRHIDPKYQISDRGISYRHSVNKHCDSHVVYDSFNQPIRSRDYLQVIQNGARDADAMLKGPAIPTLNILDKILSREHKIRCWIRGTAYYRILQLQLWLPDKCWASRLDTTRKKLLSYQALSAAIPKISRGKIVDAEIHDLIRGDIPYFWIEGRTGNLMHSTGLLIENFAMPTRKSLLLQSKKWRLRDFSRNMAPIVDRMG